MNIPKIIKFAENLCIFHITADVSSQRSVTHTAWQAAHVPAQAIYLRGRRQQKLALFKTLNLTVAVDFTIKNNSLFVKISADYVQLWKFFMSDLKEVSVHNFLAAGGAQSFTLQRAHHGNRGGGWGGEGRWRVGVLLKKIIRPRGALLKSKVLSTFFFWTIGRNIKTIWNYTFL